MEKEEQASLMHDHRFGKGERHAHKTSETLAQRVIPAFDMGSFSRLFANCGVLLAGDHRRVGRPEGRFAMPCAVGGWNGFPQPLARLFTSITDGIGDHLSRLAT